MGQQVQLLGAAINHGGMVQKKTGAQDTVNRVLADPLTDGIQLAQV